MGWHDTYRPAALAVLHGQLPYTVEIYYAAPWAAMLVYLLQKPRLLLAAVLALWVPIVLKTFFA